MNSSTLFRAKPKAPNCKNLRIVNFFYPFIYKHLRHFPTKKIPRISIKSAGPAKYGGRLLFAPGKEYRDEYENPRGPKHPLRFV